MDIEDSPTSRNIQLPGWSWSSSQNSPFSPYPRRPRQKCSWGPYQASQINNWPWIQRVGVMTYNPRMRFSWGALGQYTVGDGKVNAGKIMKKPNRKNKSPSKRRALKRKKLLMSTLADSVQPTETSYTSNNSVSTRSDSPIDMSSRASTNRWSRSPSPDDFNSSVPQLDANRSRSLSPTPALSKKSNSSPPIFTSLDTGNDKRDKWPKSRSVLDIFLQSLPDSRNLHEDDCPPHEEEFTTVDMKSPKVSSPKKIYLNRAPLITNASSSWSSGKGPEFGSEMKILEIVDLPSDVGSIPCNSTPDTVDNVAIEISDDTVSLESVDKEQRKVEKCSLVTNMHPDDESQTVSALEECSEGFAGSETKNLKSVDLPSDVGSITCISTPDTVDNVAKEISDDTVSLKSVDKEQGKEERCSLVINMHPDESQTVSALEECSEGFAGSETKILESVDLPSDVGSIPCNSTPDTVGNVAIEISDDMVSLESVDKEQGKDEKCSLVTNMHPDDESQTVSALEECSEGFTDHSPSSFITQQMSFSKLDSGQEANENGMCDSSSAVSQPDSTRNVFPQPSSEAATPIITDSTVQFNFTFPSSSDDSMSWNPSPLNFITPIGSFSDSHMEEAPSPVNCSAQNQMSNKLLASTLNERESSCEKDRAEDFSADETNANIDSEFDKEVDSDVLLEATSANSAVQSKEKLHNSLFSAKDLLDNKKVLSLNFACENSVTPVDTGASKLLSNASDSSVESLCHTEAEISSWDAEDRSVQKHTFERSTSSSKESESSNHTSEFMESFRENSSHEESSVIKELLKFPSNLSLSEDESEHQPIATDSPSPMLPENTVILENASEDLLHDEISLPFMNDSRSQSRTECISDKNEEKFANAYDLVSSPTSNEMESAHADMMAEETSSVTENISSFQATAQNISPDVTDTDSNTLSSDSERSLISSKRTSLTDSSKSEAATSLLVSDETNQSQVLVESSSDMLQSQDSLPCETSQSPLDDSEPHCLMAHIPQAVDADSNIMQTSDTFVKSSENESRNVDDENAEEQSLSRSKGKSLEESPVLSENDLSECSSTVENQNVPAYDPLESQPEAGAVNSDSINLDPDTYKSPDIISSLVESAEISSVNKSGTHQDEKESLSQGEDMPSTRAEKSFSNTTCSSVLMNPSQSNNEKLVTSLESQSLSPQSEDNSRCTDLPVGTEISHENNSLIYNEIMPDSELLDRTDASNVEEKPEIEDDTVRKSMNEECSSPRYEDQSNDEEELSEYSPMDVLDPSFENSLTPFSNSPQSPSDESDAEDIPADPSPCDSDAESENVYRESYVCSHDENYDSTHDMDTSSLDSHDSIQEMDTSVLESEVEQNLNAKQGMKRKRSPSPVTVRSIVNMEDVNDDQLLESQDRMLASSGGRLLLNKHTCRLFASQNPEPQECETPRDSKKKSRKSTDSLLELYEKSGSKGLFSPKLFHQKKRQRTITTRSSVKKLRRRQPNHDLTYISRKRMELIKAVEEGNMPRVQELVQDLGPGVQEEKTGSTLLHIAAVHNQVDLVLFLLKLISPNVVNNEGQTPAHLASMMGHTQILRILSTDEEFCHEKLNQHGKTFMDLLSAPLCDAILGKNRGKVQELLRLGADPDTEVEEVIKGQVPPDTSVSTPRQLATDLGLASILQLFPKERPDNDINETVEADIVFSANSIQPKTDKGKQYPDPLELEVTSAGQTENGEDVYPMASKPRGFVCILDYCSFQDRQDLDLEGSMQDTANLAHVFSRMGYAGEIYSCPTLDDTKDILKKIKAQDILKDSGCLVVVINSHGVGEDRFLTSDLNFMNANKTVELFRNSECPSMINKPKLFIFNTGCGLYRESKRAKYNKAMPSRISEPLQDILCLYSSNKGYASRAYSDKGTPFYSALCSTLAKHAHAKEINDLFREFLREYAKSSPVTVPELRNIGLYNKFFFNPV